MPKQTYTEYDFKALMLIINEYIAHGADIKKVDNNLFKIISNTAVLYWRQLDDEITIGCALYPAKQDLFVTITGKNPKYIGKQPFASDLYVDILKDSQVSVISDYHMSKDAFKLWKRLFKLQHTIRIYDIRNPSNQYQVYSQEGMDKYCSWFEHSKHWHYVLRK